MSNIPVWILTFNRPEALNRLIGRLGEQGFDVNIFSNHPQIKLIPAYRKYIKEIVVNTLNCDESNSWCARSWNNILIKNFHKASLHDKQHDNIICIQDDTFVGENFGNWIDATSKEYDFIWGPAGDQFFYMTFDAFRKIGWWDERYIGCYCGDAEYVKRAYMALQPGQISVEDSHNWGFRHNASDISRNIITTYESKTVDPDYDNQHWEFEKLSGGKNTTETNPTILHAQQLFRDKWGIDLDNGRPIIESLNRKMPEIDWYPWFSKKYGVNTHV